MNKLIRMEWIKLRSLRSPWILALLPLALGVAMTLVGVLSYGTDLSPDTGQIERLSTIASGMSLWAPFLGVVGVMGFGLEWKHRTIVPTVAAAPIRAEVVASKAVVWGVFGLVVTSFITAVLTVMSILIMDNRGYGIETSSRGFVELVAGMVAYGTLFVLIGFGLGLIVRSMAFSIAMVFLVQFVDSALSQIPGVDRVAPFQAGLRLIDAGELSSVFEGGGIYAAWVLALVIVAAVIFQYRDLGKA